MVKKITSIESPTLKYLTMDQVRHLITSVNDARDKIMIRILYETACTIKELTKIKVEDISGNRIRIKSAAAVRFPKISGTLARDLSLFIKGNQLGRSSFILSTRQGKNISEKRISQLIREYTSGLGIINPHQFRYFHVAHAYLNGVFIEEISDQLGLTKLRVFQVLREFNVMPRLNNYNNFLGRI